jgi:hypothetical protein
MSQETIDGKNSVVAQIYGIAGELALEIEGQRKLLDLPCARIEDTQGTTKAAYREVREEIREQLRKLLQSFVPPKKPIGFA